MNTEIVQTIQAFNQKPHTCDVCPKIAYCGEHNGPAASRFLDDGFEDKSLRRVTDVLVLGDCGKKHWL